jgi:membrane associated rhomboid family serine protease
MGQKVSHPIRALKTFSEEFVRVNNPCNLQEAYFFYRCVKDPYKMRYEYQIQRFFLPMLLHGDLGHLVSNVIAQLMIGSSLEPDIGSLKFLSLYILSG